MTIALPVSQATLLRHALFDYLTVIDKQQPPPETTAAVVVAFRQLAAVAWARANACARFATQLEHAEGLDWSREDLKKAISLLDDWRDHG